MKTALEKISYYEENEISKEFFCHEESERNDALLKDIAYDVHAIIVSSLIYQYIKDFFPDSNNYNYNQLFCNGITENSNIIDIADKTIIPSLCEKLHIIYLNSRFISRDNKIIRKKSKENLIENGAVYTQEQIANCIVERTLSKLQGDNLRCSHILDFATGTGRFYKETVSILKDKYGIEYDYSILNIVYGVDIDPIAVDICRLKAFSILTKKTLNAMKSISEHIICKNALIREIAYDDSAITPDDCNGLFYNGFDAIVSNPPYLVLKPNKRKMDEATVKNINNLAKHFRSSSYYHYSIEGMLNLYQLSLEAMLSMLKPNGEMGIICPSTLFADVSASKLRKYLLQKHNIYYIKFFSEDDPLFENVTQATCIFHLTKGTPTSNISIDSVGKKFEISIDDVKLVFASNWEIPSIDKIEWNILKKLLNVPLLKDLDFIRNKRGELDLSLYKDFITKERTELRLVRGNMISDDTINDINHEYVKSDFLKNKSIDYLTYDKGKIRLVCQQISNQTQKVRLKFVECQERDILGNSCNYITVEEGLISKMKTILNSALLNWRFKITSSNNHINNYELDQLPIIDLDKITSEVLAMDDVKRNEKICSLYGLKREESQFIIRQYYETI